MYMYVGFVYTCIIKKKRSDKKKEKKERRISKRGFSSLTIAFRRFHLRIIRDL